MRTPLGCNSGILFNRLSAFRQEQSPKRPEIVQDSPAGGYVEIQLCKVVGNQKERLFAAGGVFTLRSRNFGLHIAPGFFEGGG